jgi:hypothetical protein
MVPRAFPCCSRDRLFLIAAQRNLEVMNNLFGVPAYPLVVQGADAAD